MPAAEKKKLPTSGDSVGGRSRLHDTRGVHTETVVLVTQNPGDVTKHAPICVCCKVALIRNTRYKSKQTQNTVRSARRRGEQTKTKTAFCFVFCFTRSRRKTRTRGSGFEFHRRNIPRRPQRSADDSETKRERNQHTTALIGAGFVRTDDKKKSPPRTQTKHTCRRFVTVHTKETKRY